MFFVAQAVFVYHCFICATNFDWAQVCKAEIHFSSWPKVPKFQRKVQQTLVVTTEPSTCTFTFTLLPFPSPLYMEMKRSFMLFPLVALFIAVWRFISWFHLRFCRLLLGKPLKCVSDSKQSFFPLSLACSSRLLSQDKKKTKKTVDFQSDLSYPLKPKSIQYCPKERRCCSCFMADMKGEQRIICVISLISIISVVWMNFKWLAWSYLCYRSTTIICSVLEAAALRMRWLCAEESWYVSDAATRWRSRPWFWMRCDEKIIINCTSRFFLNHINTKAKLTNITKIYTSWDMIKKAIYSINLFLSAFKQS